MKVKEKDARTLEDAESGFTLIELLMAMTFVEPFVGVIDSLRRAGSHPLRYVVGIPAALTMAVLLVWLSWNVTKILITRSEGRSKTLQILTGMAALTLHVFWIVAGAIAGYKLGALLISLI